MLQRETFILRLFTAEDAGQARQLFVLQDVKSGAEMRFETIGELATFLQKRQHDNNATPNRQNERFLTQNEMKP